MQFEVFNKETGKVDSNLFNNSKAAMRRAFQLRTDDGSDGWKIRRVVSDKWKERERIAYKEDYTHCPWEDEPWFTDEHVDTYFPHIKASEGISGVSITPNNEAGEDNHKVTLTIGRYLTRFFRGDLTDVEINQWSAKLLRERYELHVVTDPDKIVNIYMHCGIRSCMSHREDEYMEGHPMRILGHPETDLKLLVLVDKTSKSRAKGSFQGCKVVGRAICWPEKKTYLRSYGFTEGFKEVAEATGWVNAKIDGAMVKAIPIKHERWLLPWIDSSGSRSLSNVFYRDGFFILTTKDLEGLIGCGTTDGSVAFSVRKAPDGMTYNRRLVEYTSTGTFKDLSKVYPVRTPSEDPVLKALSHSF